jgi:Rha family phage regulatory protein|nr:MAG TPA: regulatory protein [Caudoviricetes sp.]
MPKNKITERIITMLVEVSKINKQEVTVVSSLDVAETFEKRHADVLRDIENLGCSTEFRERNFAFSEYKVEGNNKKYPMYYITRDGFTLLAMGYTGEKAMKFKEAYIKQFNVMEKTLQGKLIEREKGIAVRQSLTKALQQSTENERMHGHAYSTYTNCIYKVLFGMNANKLREHYGIPKKDNLRDCFTAEQLRDIESMEMLVSSLINCGWGYDRIKSFIEVTNVKKIAC